MSLQPLETGPNDLYPREIDYNPRNDSNCASASAAYMMFRIDAPEEMWSPDTIDKLTGRRAQRSLLDKFLGRNNEQLTLNEYPILEALLEHGAEVLDVSDWDTQRFLDEGLAYAEEYHRDGWIARDRDSFYEVEKIRPAAKVQEIAVEFYTKTVPSHPDQWHEIKIKPDVKVVEDLVQSGHIVEVAIDPFGSNTSSHSVVVTEVLPGKDDTDPNVIRFFDNNLKPPFTSMREDLFGALMVRESGVLAVKLPQLLERTEE